MSRLWQALGSSLFDKSVIDTATVSGWGAGWNSHIRDGVFAQFGAWSRRGSVLLLGSCGSRVVDRGVVAISFSAGRYHNSLDAVERPLLAEGGQPSVLK